MGFNRQFRRSVKRIGMVVPQNKQELLDAIRNTYKKLIVDLAEVSTEHDRIVALVEQERYSSLYGMS